MGKDNEMVRGGVLMEKKWQAIIVIAGLLVFFYLGGFGLLQSVVYGDNFILDGESSVAPTNLVETQISGVTFRESDYGRGYGTTFNNDFSYNFDNTGECYINSRCGFSFKRDLSNNNYKVEASIGKFTNVYLCEPTDALIAPNSGYPNIKLTELPGGLVDQTSSGRGWTGSPLNYFLELRHSVINPDELQVLLNGGIVNTVNIASKNKPSLCFINGQGSLTNPRYEPIFGCPSQPNDLLAIESFAPGATICYDNLRYQADLQFCDEHPPILTSLTGSTVDNLMEIPTLLLADQCYTVPQDQTITMLYKFDNTDGLVTVTCSDGEAVNINGECQSYTGVVTVCSAGTFDPVQGTCVVTAFEPVCETGSYNPTTKVCEYSLPSTGVCPSGQTLSSDGTKCEYLAQPASTPVCESGRYDLSLNACIYNPPVQQVCEQGTLIDGQCILQLSIDSTCPDGYTFNQDTLSCVLPIADTGLTLSPSAQDVVTRVSTTYPTTVSSLAGVTPSTTTSGGLKGFINKITNVILVLFAIALIINIFLYWIQPSGVSWNSVKAYLRRNKEGLAIGALIGVLAVYYAQGWDNIAMIVWTALTFGLIGMVIDHLFNPRK
jgi:hypothetical protein